MMALKPFITSSIERFGDIARVQIVRVTDMGEAGLRREVLEDYETLSRGAAKSARREIVKASGTA